MSSALANRRAEKLACRVEAMAEPAWDLNSDVLDWLSEVTGRSVGTIMIRFPTGLVFDAEGVEVVLHEMLPGARFTTGTLSHNVHRRGAGVFMRGHEAPFVAEAETTANALLAAFLRAYAATASPGVAWRAA